MALTVASLHIYPIKSLGGFAVEEGHLTERRFAHDRRWILLTGDNFFVTQREWPAFACLHSSQNKDCFFTQCVVEAGVG